MCSEIMAMGLGNACSLACKIPSMHQQQHVKGTKQMQPRENFLHSFSRDPFDEPQTRLSQRGKETLPHRLCVCRCVCEWSAVCPLPLRPWEFCKELGDCAETWLSQ